jgi:type IV secretory pathway TraG/TraD family ATPase VirD4
MFSQNCLAIPTDKLSHHIAFAGDSGTGKTTLLRQLITYAENAGNTAIVLDSTRKFVAEYYKPERGDTILDPTDARTAYWALEDEITNEADAMSVTAAFYPKEPNEQHWFVEQAMRIGAYVLSEFHPSCYEFGKWLTDPRELDERVKGTEHAETLSHNAAPQRAGILGTMNKVGFAFRMMPRPCEKATRRIFCIRQWVHEREGWLFLPNDASTRDALKPIQSGWVDMAMLRVMDAALNERLKERRIWAFLDELLSIGKLPKLAECLAMWRQTGNIIAYGLQNISQLKKAYDKDANTIFSQPFNKFILGTTDKESADILQGLVGDWEGRSFRSSRTTGIVGGHERDNFSGPEEQIKPLILSSEIQGLPDLTSYYLRRPLDNTIGLNVAKIRIPYDEPKYRHKLHVPRDIPPTEKYVPSEPPPKKARRQTRAVRTSGTGPQLVPPAAPDPSDDPSPEATA